MGDILFHGMDELVTISGDDSTPSTHPPLAISVDVSNREELDELLKRFPTFIDMEPPMSDMNDLILATQRIPMDVDGDPKQSYVAGVLYGTLDDAIKAIMWLKDYTTM